MNEQLTWGLCIGFCVCYILWTISEAYEYFKKKRKERQDAEKEETCEKGDSDR